MSACGLQGPKECVAETGMAATAFPAATDAAVEMLRAGGNAIDAAVAAAWALAVCEPSGSGLGGKTVMLVHLATGKDIVIDGHSQAPAAASKKRISRTQQQTGYLASTVPSTVATLGYAQRLYGALPLHQVMAPAIRLAEDGYPISRLQWRQLRWCLAELQASPSAAGLFLNGGLPFREGAVFRQPELAGTLQRLAHAGTDDFYTGEIARDLVDDMARHGGLITKADLAESALPVERSPVVADYRGYPVVSIPPPGGGLQVLLGLKVLENWSSDELCENPEVWHKIIVEVIHAVFCEAESLPMTGEKLTPSAVQWFLGNKRAAEIYGQLQESKMEPRRQSCKPDEPGETTHLCTADGQGNVVSLTQSIQSLFGAKVANAKLGFFYNNCLRTCPRHPHPYQLAGRCVPRSNAAPTIVFTKEFSSAGAGMGVFEVEHKPCLALGAAGSRRIISAILQVISHVMDRGLSLAEAMDSPRGHVMLSGKVHVEKSAETIRLKPYWTRRFGKVRIRARRSYFMGAVQAIQFGQDGTLMGMADPRRDGTSGGL